MKERQCIHCGEFKQLSEFFANKRMTLGVESKCKECAKKYQRKKRREKWSKLFNYKGAACQHCGISEYHRPEIYEFHHVDPKTKEYQIADLLMCKWERVKEEADKCLMLCANCHKTEHARMRNVKNN